MYSIGYNKKQHFLQVSLLDGVRTRTIQFHSYFEFSIHDFHGKLAIVRLINPICEKTRAYTSGTPLPHGARPQETTPTSSFCLFTNGPPESPMQAPCDTGLFVQIVLACTLAPIITIQSERLRLFVFLNCKILGWALGWFDGGPACLINKRIHRHLHQAWVMLVRCIWNTHAELSPSANRQR